MGRVAIGCVGRGNKWSIEITINEIRGALMLITRE